VVLSEIGEELSGDFRYCHVFSPVMHGFIIANRLIIIENFELNIFLKPLINIEHIFYLASWILPFQEGSRGKYTESRIQRYPTQNLGRTSEKA
jgi:hypothetical protein